MSSTGIVYSPWVPGADQIANTLARRVSRDDGAWVASLLDVEGKAALPADTGLLVTVGGDGTILRVVRATAPSEVPLVGVNMGRVGFMTELSAAEAPDRIAAYARGEGWLEERTLLEAQILSAGAHSPDPAKKAGLLLGLNEAVVGSRGLARLVHVDVCVDGHLVATYSCDAVVVATATGSTGYALSAGGPILYGESQSLLIKPVSPQLSLNSALVLHPDRVVEMTTRTNGQAALCVDGFVDVDLAHGDVVRVQRSPHTARFLRSDPRPRLPEALTQRLGSPPRST